MNSAQNQLRKRLSLKNFTLNVTATLVETNPKTAKKTANKPKFKVIRGSTA